MTSVEDRFNAAVNVIKSLPKNGSFQPSNAMMLTFYSYFKQATQGPCRQNKPGFWDVVGRAKWDAWRALGDMDKDRAMQLYVEELKKIIETMSYTENVANFMGSIGELDGVNVDDLEAIAPEVIKKARSNPNSPLSSRNTSPTRPPNYMNGYTNGDSGISNGNESFDHQNDSYNQHNGYSSTIDQSDDEYIDTMDRAESNLEIVASQILKIVQKMDSDIAAVNQRMDGLEKQLSEVARSNQQIRKLSQQRKYPHWWPFKDISPVWFIMLILWPFVVKRVGVALQRKK